MSRATLVKENAFYGAADNLEVGIDALFSDDGPKFSLIPLDMIDVRDQIREEFEDDENTLEDLAASIKVRGVLQPILLRPTQNGYELIAGERRYRASKLAGLNQIPAYIREMTDDEADDAQLAENIHRKNLTQTEEAKKIQRDLDSLGSVELVLQKHQKSRAWLSKILSLLNLPEQAKRLISENVSADIEVINTVKTVEKIDPKKAQKLVDDLKKTRGKANARDKALAVKEEVKQTKKKKTQKANHAESISKENSDEGLPIPDEMFTTSGISLSADILNQAYFDIFENARNPKEILDEMSEENKEIIRGCLHPFYKAGGMAKDIGRTVIQCFRSGQFSSDGCGAFALTAFLYGTDSKSKFNLLDIFGSIKK